MEKKEILEQLADRADTINRWGGDFGCNQEVFAFTDWLAKKGIILEHEHEFWEKFEGGLDLDELRKLLKAHGCGAEVTYNEIIYWPNEGQVGMRPKELIGDYYLERKDEPWLVELFEKLGCEVKVEDVVQKESRGFRTTFHGSYSDFGEYNWSGPVSWIQPEQMIKVVTLEMKHEWNDDEIYEEALNRDVECLYDEGGWISQEKGYVYISNEYDDEEIYGDFWKALDAFEGARIGEFEDLYDDKAGPYMIKAKENGLEFESGSDAEEFYKECARFEFDFTPFALKAAKRNGGKFNADKFDFWDVQRYNEAGAKAA